MRTCYVYILASTSRCLYVGVTNDLLRRLWQHRHSHGGFTARYRIDKLVHLELFPDPRSAIEREKEIKRWRRDRKERLILAHNAGWHDLSRDWFDEAPRVAVDPGCSRYADTRSKAPRPFDDRALDQHKR